MRRFRCGRQPENGNAQIEFALCGIFIIFLLISIFDMARGLWIYHTLAEAVRDGTRYSIVRASQYTNPADGQRLPGATFQATANYIRQSAVGIVPSDLTLVFEEVSSGGVATPVFTCTGASCNDPSRWPRDEWGTTGLTIGITARYPYNSMAGMFFPGSKAVMMGKYVLGSTSRATIVF